MPSYAAGSNMTVPPNPSHVCVALRVQQYFLRKSCFPAVLLIPGFLMPYDSAISSRAKCLVRGYAKVYNTILTRRLLARARVSVIYSSNSFISISLSFGG